jgi:hypothetical protein
VQSRLGSIVDASRPAAARRIVPERTWAAIRIAAAPEHSRPVIDAQTARNVCCRQAISSQQNDVRATDDPLWNGSRPDPRAKKASFALADPKLRGVRDCHPGRHE